MSGTHKPHSGQDPLIYVEHPGKGIAICGGTTVPTDGGAGYATGCLFLHVDGGAGTALYVNEGTNTSCDFDAASVA